MICIECNSEVSDKARFCGNCGAKFSLKQYDPNHVLFCEHCGNKKTYVSESCENCGAPPPISRPSPLVQTDSSLPSDFNIVKNPLGLVEFTLNKGERITAEAGAMVFMKGDITTETKMREGGFLKNIKTTLFGFESFFINEFIAEEDNCKLGLTGNMLGDIEVIHVEEEFILQAGSFVGTTGDLTIDTKWQGLKKGIFGTGLFMLKTVGSGDMYVNAWGGIIKKVLKDEETIIVDNYQLVALNSTAEYEIRKHGNFKTTIFGGEALVVHITGPATVYLQTKNVLEFVRALQPYIKATMTGWEEVLLD